MLRIVLVVLWVSFVPVYARGGDVVRAYPAPEGEPLSPKFTVMVEKTSVPVYLARICALTPEQRQTLRDATLADTSQTAFRVPRGKGGDHVGAGAQFEGGGCDPPRFGGVDAARGESGSR